MRQPPQARGRPQWIAGDTTIPVSRPNFGHSMESVERAGSYRIKS